MPWTEQDVDRHNKGLSPLKKRQWLHVANGVLSETGNEGEAIRKANAVVREALVDVEVISTRDAIRAQRHRHPGYAVLSECARCVTVHLLERESALAMLPVDLIEKSSDEGGHPYGAWHGGKKSEGGGPGPAPGGKAARIADMQRTMHGKAAEPFDKESGRPGSDDPKGRKAYDEARAKAEAGNDRLKAQKQFAAEGGDPKTGRPGSNDPAGQKAWDEGYMKAKAAENAAASPKALPGGRVSNATVAASTRQGMTTGRISRADVLAGKASADAYAKQQDATRLARQAGAARRDALAGTGSAKRASDLASQSALARSPSAADRTVATAEQHVTPSARKAFMRAPENATFTTAGGATYTRREAERVLGDSRTSQAKRVEVLQGIQNKWGTP